MPKGIDSLTYIKTRPFKDPITVLGYNFNLGFERKFENKNYTHFLFAIFDSIGRGWVFECLDAGESTRKLVKRCRGLYTNPKCNYIILSRAEVERAFDDGLVLSPDGLNYIPV